MFQKHKEHMLINCLPSFTQNTADFLISSKMPLPRTPPGFLPYQLPWRFMGFWVLKCIFKLPLILDPKIKVHHQANTSEMEVRGVPRWGVLCRTTLIVIFYSFLVFCLPNHDLCQYQFLHAYSSPDLFALSDCHKSCLNYVNSFIIWPAYSCFLVQASVSYRSNTSLVLGLYDSIEPW